MPLQLGHRRAKYEAMNPYRTFSIKDIIFSYCWQLSEFDYDTFFPLLIWLISRDNVIQCISLRILELSKDAECAKTLMALEIAG